MGTLTTVALIFHNFNWSLYLLGDLLHLHRYWLSSKFLSTTVRTHLGTQDFSIHPKALGFSQGVQAVHQAYVYLLRVSPIESLGFF